MENTQLIKVITDSKVEASTADSLQKAFAPFLTTLTDWSDKSKTLVVTDVTQVREMNMAREARLALKDIRVKAKKKKDELKEDSLRYGKAVQSVYNMIEGLITPMEEHFSLQERFAEIQEEKLKAALRLVREVESKEFAEFISVTLDLGELSEEKYQELLAKAKQQYQAQIEFEEKQERERLAKLEAEEQERKRIIAENEKLKAEQKRINAENEALRQQAKGLAIIGASPIEPSDYPSFKAPVKDKVGPFFCFLCGTQLDEGSRDLLYCPDCLSTFIPSINAAGHKNLTCINY